MAATRTQKESARALGAILALVAAGCVATLAAYSSDRGGLLPLSDEVLALEVPAHCTATRGASGYSIHCKTPAAVAGNPGALGVTAAAVLGANAAQYETALQISETMGDLASDGVQDASDGAHRSATRQSSEDGADVASSDGDVLPTGARIAIAPEG